MLIKICGITNVDDARFALAAGADWIGLNLVGGPRRIDLDAVSAIASQLEGASRAVALVRVEPDGVSVEVLGHLRKSGVRRLQLYGTVTCSTLEQLSREGFASIVAFSATDEAPLGEVDGLLTSCGEARPEYLLLDAGTQQQPGGTGRRLDWAWLGRQRAAGRFGGWPPVILAGGLTPENVSEAIRQVRPAGVDVSSGVENRPGRKDRSEVARFVLAARRAD